MAIIKCKECGTEVTTYASPCPHCGISLRSGTTAAFDGILRSVFIGFNVLMLVWYIAVISAAGSGTDSPATAAQTAAGTEFGATMIVFIWISGAFLLALFNWFTRAKG